MSDSILTAEQEPVVEVELPSGETLCARLNRTASTCYFMRTGRCSLDIVSDFSLPELGRLTGKDLMYCPQLYRLMCRERTEKAVTVTAEVGADGCGKIIHGQPRACICMKKGLPIHGKLTARKK